MSPAGRPPLEEGKRDNTLKIRLNDDELETLNYCADKLKITKAEVIRRAINIFKADIEK